jgi:2OG-Fe(II) oxygenase superfamily
LDTLVRAVERETLSPEIYQILHDIYGFSNFNYDESSSNNKALSKSLFSKDDALQLHELPAWKDEDMIVLHVNPLVLSIDNFFTRQECQTYMKLSATGKETMSPTAGGNQNATIREQRTSITWFHYFETVPELLSKASRLLGLRDIRNRKEVQTVRYRPGEQFTWHLDALGGGGAPFDEFMAMGGQRIATLIVYLNDLTDHQGGATMFRDLLEPVRFDDDDDDDEIVNARTRLSVRPQQGRALLFFPAAGGIPNVPSDTALRSTGNCYQY